MPDVDLDGDNQVKVNIHPGAELHQGEHSLIPHPPPEDHHDNRDYKTIPDTGWRGKSDVPSEGGGDGEDNFVNKPPYTWKSEGNLFKPKYYTCVHPDFR